jgi:gluconolactonase
VATTRPDPITITDGLKFPEGPVALSDGTLLVGQIVTGELTRVHPDGRHELVAACGGGVNGVAIGPDGAAYVTNNGGSEHAYVASRGWYLPGDQAADFDGGGVQRVDLANGDVTWLYTHVDGHRLRGPNDLVFDGHGGFWFTDHGKGRARERDRGGVYYATADGTSVREVLYPLDGPNGIGLSPDGTRLYVAETFAGRLWAWDVTAPGQLRAKPHGRVFGGDLLVGLGGYDMFDSMAVDADGYVCVATIGDHAGITVVAPDGSGYHHVLMPDPMPTNICFGGPDLRTAYVTLSAAGRLVSFEWPRPGLRLHHA